MTGSRLDSPHGLLLPTYRQDGDDTHPPLDSPAYKSTGLRSPRQPLITLPQQLTEVTGPLFGEDRLGQLDGNLTAHGSDEPIGQRIIVHGQVRDGDGRAVPHTLVEIWQANAAGRYRHPVDNWPAALDPNFTGAGRVMTDGEGRYEFLTIRPGAYPWGNHHNAWRPAHIHLSLFGRAFTQRLVTQMYFPDDPMHDLDPILNSVPESARHRLVSEFDMAATQPQWALGYRFDIVLRGRQSTPFESEPSDGEDDE